MKKLVDSLLAKLTTLRRVMMIIQINPNEVRSILPVYNTLDKLNTQMGIKLSLSNKVKLLLNKEIRLDIDGGSLTYSKESGIRIYIEPEFVVEYMELHAKLLDLAIPSAVAFLNAFIQLKQVVPVLEDEGSKFEKRWRPRHKDDELDK